MNELIDSPINLDSCRSLLAERDRQIATLEGEVVSLRQRLNDALEACGTPEFTRFTGPATESEKTQFVAMAVQASVAKESNGVTAPKSGVTKRVWEIADRITTMKREKGEPPATKAEVVAVAVLEEIKETTAQASYSAWAKFFEINAKDTSKPYVAKLKEIKLVESVQTPSGELAEVVVLPANSDPLDFLIGRQLLVQVDLGKGHDENVTVFAPPPPLPVFLPPPPLPPV